MNALGETPELAEHLAGEPLKAIGARRGVSHEQARRIIRAQGNELVGRIAGQVLLARREGGSVPVATLSDVGGYAGFHLGLRYVDWLVGELAGLTIACRVHIEPIEGGYSVALTEVVDEGGDR